MRRNRTDVDVAIDMAASALLGTAQGVEKEFGGDMRATAVSLDRALATFLEDVSREAGAEVAATFANRLIDTLIGFTEDGGEVFGAVVELPK